MLIEEAEPRSPASHRRADSTALRALRALGEEVGVEDGASLDAETVAVG